ncbi:WD40-repeat-containing domain protein [Pterulicium gracile]|uniref:WD40-repeat-containing domain protein n=1 Tax=Pterulicium gracile TaxID=1884261 RepID=A0A5C3Q5D5_9AGAR|nr:WD40-repeat-containing domain protein [Pterula gracilis]
MALTSSYLLACLHLPAANLYAVSTSTPENAVLLLNDETRRIQKSLQHPNVITRLRLARNFLGGQERLLTSCKDGSVRVWDIQSGDCIRTFSTSPRRAILSFDISQDKSTIAAGTELAQQEAHIIFFSTDPESTDAHPGWVHTSTHSDDVTCLNFLGSSSQILSASTDGCLCISDASVKDEEEAVLSTSNWGCSIAQAGVIDDELIWAGSDMETFSVWSIELDKIADINIKSDPENPSIPSSAKSDYLVTVSSQPRGLIVGSYEGQISLLSLPKNSSSPLKLLHAPTSPLTGPPHATETVVRCALLVPEKDRVVTGAEDGMICVWPWPQELQKLKTKSAKRSKPSEPVEEVAEDRMDVDEEQEKPVKVKKRKKSKAE